MADERRRPRRRRPSPPSMTQTVADGLRPEPARADSTATPHRSADVSAPLKSSSAVADGLKRAAVASEQFGKSAAQAAKTSAAASRVPSPKPPRAGPPPRPPKSVAIAMQPLDRPDRSDKSAKSDRADRSPAPPAPPADRRPAKASSQPNRTAAPAAPPIPLPSVAIAMQPLDRPSSRSAKSDRADRSPAPPATPADRRPAKASSQPNRTAAPAAPQQTQAVAGWFEKAANTSDRFWKSMERASIAILKVTAALAASIELWAAYRGGTAAASGATSLFSAVWAQLAARFPIVAGILSGLWSATSGIIVAGCTAATAALATLWAAIAPIAIPLAAVAAVVGIAFAVWAKWDKIPLWLKILFPPLIAIKLAVEALLLPFRAAAAAAKLFVNTVLLPFRAVAGAARLTSQGIGLIPGALARLPGAAMSAAKASGTALAWLGSAGASTVKTITTSLVSLTKAVVTTGYAVTKGLVSGSMSAAAGLITAPGRALGAVSGRLWAIAQPMTEKVQKMFNKAADKSREFGQSLVGPINAAAVAFAAAGVSLGRLETQYGLTADQANVYAAASRMTGVAVKDLVASMPTTSAAYAAFAKEAAANSVTMTQSEIDSARSLTVTYGRLAEAKKGLWQLVGSAMAPAIQESTELVLGAVRSVTAWLREHKEAIAIAFKVGSVALTVAGILAGLGTVAGSVGAVIGVLAMSFGVLASIATPLIVTAGAAAAAITLWGSAAGQAGRALASDVWSRYASTVAAAWQKTVQYGKQIVAYIQGVVQGITDAIRGGKIELAVQIAWTGAKLAWTAGLLEISTLTGGTISAILAQLASGQWSGAAEAAMASIKIVWTRGLGQLASLWGSLRGVWDELTIAADAAWTGIVNTADTAFVRMIDAADPWWLALQYGWQKARDEVSVWLNTTVAAIQVLSWTAHGFVKGFSGALSWAFKALFPLASIGIAGFRALKDMMSAAAPLEVMSTQSTADLIKQARPKPKPGQAAGPAAQPLAPGQKPDETYLEFLARVRRERRQMDLEARTGGRWSASSTRESDTRWKAAERAAAAAQEQAAREQQIAALEERIAYLQQQGTQVADGKAAALQQQLAEAKAEAAKAAEEARMRGQDLPGAALQAEKLADQAEKANKQQAGLSTAGTMSSFAALAMFGGGGSDQIAKDQLREQRRIAAETKRSADTQDKMLQRFGVGLQFVA